MSLTLGDPAPDFDLPGVDGADHTLGDYAEADVLALVQWCNHCPYVHAWEPRLIALAGDFAARGVRVVAISSNDARGYPEDSFPEMKARAQRQAYPFDYLYDESQDLAHTLGSKRTPEVFVFDSERRLRYHGALDDNRDDRQVERHYLRDALEALLADAEPPVAQTDSVGCSVKYRR